MEIVYCNVNKLRCVYLLCLNGRRFVNCFSLHPSVEHAERVIVSVNVKIHFGAMTSIDLNV